jgi:hypothetical protein
LFKLSIVSLVFVAGLPDAGANVGELTLVRVDQYPEQSVKKQDAKLTVAEMDDQPAWQVNTGHEADWPGITLTALDGPWDLSTFEKVALVVRNADTKTMTVNCRVDSPGGDGEKNSVTDRVELAPGETKELSVRIKRLLPKRLAEKLYGMRGYPGGYDKDKGLDASQISQLIIFLNKPQQDHVFQIGSIRALGSFKTPGWLTKSPDEFFPMIDKFGQFMHDDWPGKVHSDDELKQDVMRDRLALSEDPGPAGWDQYGGWRSGPQLKSTGFFYPLKRNGKWWLVDPEGRLFWSHGVDCVRFANATTPITDREFYFAELPGDDSPLAQFYGHASWAPHGYYEGKGRYRTFNFTGANLARKYGDDWQPIATDVTHRRLRSWGLNSIGNWSDSQIYLERKTPYVVASGSSGAKPIEGSQGYWGKFPDPFDTSFRAAVDRQLGWHRDKTAGDPWCIGYFVDNELAWGEEYSLAVATLASPPEQAAKKSFLADLQNKYTKIQRLNQVWSTDHKDWESLAKCQTPPDQSKAADDLGAFATKIAEEYFRHCRGAVKAIAPNNLYLGCRFAWVNDRVAKVAAKYCDVIGYNLYRDSVTDFELPAGVDKPVVIGEFHFGALDRGMFHTGLRPTANQQARAEAYRSYLTGALNNPCLVGSHWFQFGDQATTGRGDGENYQIGLLNICDRPYPETIAVVREIGQIMYELRSGARKE